MKKIFLFFLICFSQELFAQQKDSMVVRKNLEIRYFYHKNKTYLDSTMNVYTTKKIATEVDSSGMKFMGTAIRNELFDSYKTYTLDSIPDDAIVNVNNILKIRKSLLKSLNSYKILDVRKGKEKKWATELYTFKDDVQERYWEQIEFSTIPKALVVQEHNYLPQDFFLFKNTTLQPIRYRCFADVPVWDYLIESTNTSKKPIYVLDGRIQPESFEMNDILEKQIKSIEVYDQEDGKKFFGKKAKYGIISIATKAYKGDVKPLLNAIRIVGEIEVKLGNWEMVSDTTVDTIDAFVNFRKKTLLANGGVIYLIDGELESEKTNRKTIDLDNVESISIKKSPEKKIDNHVNGQIGLTFTTDFEDTISIKTGKRRLVENRNTNPSVILLEMQMLRSGENQTSEKSTLPLYIIDGKEISSKDLQKYKVKDYDVEVISSDDALDKYGKKGINGAMIYKRKQ
jgi:hypothetical protein